MHTLMEIIESWPQHLLHRDNFSEFRAALGSSYLRNLCLFALELLWGSSLALESYRQRAILDAMMLLFIHRAD